jgi:hypothetical protein
VFGLPLGLSGAVALPPAASAGLFNSLFGLSGSASMLQAASAGNLASVFGLSGATQLAAAVSAGVFQPGPLGLSGGAAVGLLTSAGLFVPASGLGGLALEGLPSAAGQFVTIGGATGVVLLMGAAQIAALTSAGVLVQSGGLSGAALASQFASGGAFVTLPVATRLQPNTGLANIYSIGPTLVAKITPGIFGVGPMQQYRPINLGPVQRSYNFLGLIPAWITGDANLMARKSIANGQPIAYAALDPTSVQTGDYLIGQISPSGPTYTFFVCTIDPPRPIQLIVCNGIVDVRATPTFLGTGSLPGYGGDVQANEPLKLEGWPAAINPLGSKARAGALRLPGDGDLGWMDIRLPSLPPGESIAARDRVYDDQGNRMLIADAVLTLNGWRLACQLALT